MNNKLSKMPFLLKYIQIQGWSHHQDKEFSWNKGNLKANNDIILWKWGNQE